MAHQRGRQQFSGLDPRRGPSPARVTDLCPRPVGGLTGHCPVWSYLPPTGPDGGLSGRRHSRSRTIGARPAMWGTPPGNANGPDSGSDTCTTHVAVSSFPRLSACGHWTGLSTQCDRSSAASAADTDRSADRAVAWSASRSASMACRTPATGPVNWQVCPQAAVHASPAIRSSTAPGFDTSSATFATAARSRTPNSTTGRARVAGAAGVSVLVPPGALTRRVSPV